MSCPAEEANPRAVETGKSRLNPRNMLGDRIWLVGRDEGTDKYYLHGFFVVDSFVDRRSVRSQSRSRALSLRGSIAHRFHRKVRIDREAWFRLYKDDMNQLSLGLQSVKEPHVLDGLFRTLRKHRVAAV